jgi:hypothetical protein
MKRKKVWIAVLMLALTLLLARYAVQATDTCTVANTYIIVSNTNDSGLGSLRQAIVDANGNIGPDIIAFNIPGSGAHTIQPASPLPYLSGGSITIDGYSQNGALEATDTTSATLKIEIDGTNLITESCLAISSAGNVIKGLAINRCPWDGVRIYGPSAMSNTIAGNYIGTDVSGTTVLSNTQFGVSMWYGADHNTVGGSTPGERNVISGNGWGNVAIYDSSDNIVLGNYVGTEASGTANLGTPSDGVYVGGSAQNNAVGPHNVISGNEDGVRIEGSTTTSNTVFGNYIGTQADSTDPLGNHLRGVYIETAASDNTVGPDNVIAHNGYDGVSVVGGSTTGNTITRNSIFSNDMGIDLLSGANGAIETPTIVATTLGSINVVGFACPGCTVEVFENGDADGEGETYVARTTADGSGAFTITVGALTEPYLTATATDVVSGTSEFSAVFTTTLRSIFLPLISNSH